MWFNVPDESFSPLWGPLRQICSSVIRLRASIYGTTLLEIITMNQPPYKNPKDPLEGKTLKAILTGDSNFEIEHLKVSIPIRHSYSNRSCYSVVVEAYA